VAEYFPSPVKNLLGFFADLGTNPITREHDNMKVHAQPL
jgi:hypothetical protein